ncbi:MAG TPA: hypothetical protein VGW75_01035 [Solirubrobacteraceae bacterium]|jgi:hypothetical protein|nr:hypothetical protein [Solirubrobacteraceae bacterium]
MTTLDDDLSDLRRRLRAAAANDLRRGRRRRRALQLALVSAILLTGAGGALAVAPMFGEPAPPAVQGEFSDDRSRMEDPRVPGSDLQLHAVARAGGSTLYAGTNAGGWCMAVGREDGSGRATDGFSCQPNGVPAPGKVALVHGGGGPDRAHNVVTGLVREAATTVTIELVTGETVDAEIGREGFFIVQLPDSVLDEAGPERRVPGEAPREGDRGVVTGVVARDADGTVVARYDAGG